jgi:hypothetical protein
MINEKENQQERKPKRNDIAAAKLVSCTPRLTWSKIPQITITVGYTVFIYAVYSN